MGAPPAEMSCMSDKAFVDTNILIYAYDVDAGEKHAIAADLIRQLWHSGMGLLSTQVLQEFYVNVTAKMSPTLSLSAARSIIARYLVWHVEANTPESVLRASEIQERNRLSFWDALIIAAASSAGAVTLYTEDLNHGQVMEGVRIHNPFLA